MAARNIQASGDLFVLGANAIQSPAIMLRSGLGGEFVGLGLHESYGWNFEVYLDGVDNFDGSTITTGLNFGLYDGPHRAEHAAALVYFENRWQHGMRAEKGRLRQTLPLVIVTENLLDPENHVILDKDENAFVSFKGASDYAVNGMAKALESCRRCLSRCRSKSCSIAASGRPNRMCRARCGWALALRIRWSTAT